MRYAASLLAVLSLSILGGCGGGGSSSSQSTQPTTATSLSYQNPTATTGFSLVQDIAASTSTHLVLDLIGPSGTQTLGIALFLSVDTTKAVWSFPTAGAGAYVAPGSVIPLGSSPRMLASKVQNGALQVGLFQKGGAATTLGTAPILSVALDLNGSAVPKGTVELSPQSGKASVSVNANGTQSPITINVGTLTAQ
jgi:hypothetical protein